GSVVVVFTDSSGYQYERVLFIGRFAGPFVVKCHEPGQSSGAREQIGVESRSARMVFCRTRPLDPLSLDTLIAYSAVDRYQARDFVHDLGGTIVMHGISHQR